MNLARYRFILSRPLQLLPVLFGISMITFVLVRSIPGDPARALLGSRSTPEALIRIRAQYGLDQPLWMQYFYFLKNLLKGDLGQSLLYKVDALKLISTRIEPTLFLVLGSVLLALLIAVPLATVAARNKGGWQDHLIRLFTTAGLGMPAFWLGIMLILLFSVQLGLFPVSGYGRTAWDKLHHMVLPCLTIALALCAVLVRNLRANMLMELHADHATAARARGLSERAIFRRHVLPNSLVPAVNLLAVNIGWLISGTVVIESLFAIPGIGQLLVRGIFTRDYMVVQGVAMVLALATVTVNFLADVLTVMIDPRVNMR
ncbi:MULTISPECIES: ABC transporter permease [unclassified Pseudomonas]|uniref:ABC transporter permease n=1 Tax=unclassified Pseudomonas TaxID=196821 RepID=UPI0030D7A0DD